MKGLTHVFFGVGFVGMLLALVRIDFVLWVIGTFILAPFFSRIPDYDQKIARLTFNQIVPHRGKLSHNLLIGFPLILILWLPENSSIFLLGFIGIFGALFAHVFTDMWNYGGVWLGIFKLKFGWFTWDSRRGNWLFKFIGIILLGTGFLTYI